jgi:hypothetical protein
LSQLVSTPLSTTHRNLSSFEDFGLVDFIVDRSSVCRWYLLTSGRPNFCPTCNQTLTPLIKHNQMPQNGRLTHTSASDLLYPTFTDYGDQLWQQKSTQNAISPELQSFIDEIAARYQPDPKAQHRRIENAEARYNRYQNFTDIPARLVDKFQSLILKDGGFILLGLLQLLPTHR